MKQLRQIFDGIHFIPQDPEFEELKKALWKQNYIKEKRFLSFLRVFF